MSAKALKKSMGNIPVFDRTGVLPILFSQKLGGGEVNL